MRLTRNGGNVLFRGGPVETRGRWNVGKSIQQRPKEVRKRDSFGHWELDTVVSSRGKSKACVAAFAERKTRLYLAVKMPDRTSASLEKAFGVVAASFPKGTFQTATVDRGKEFACYERLESAHDLLAKRHQRKREWSSPTILPQR